MSTETATTSPLDDKMPAGRIPPPVEPPPSRLGSSAALFAGFDSLALGTVWLTAPEMLTEAMIAAAVATSGVMWLQWQGHARACVLALAATQVQAAVRGRIEVKGVWKPSWGVGMPRKLTIRYDPMVRASLGESTAGKIAAAMSLQLGSEFTVKTHKAIRNRLVLVPAPEKEAAGSIEIATERVKDVTAQVFGPKASVAIKNTSDDEVRQFLVTHQAGARLASDSVQQKVSMVMSALLPGRWKATYLLETDQVEFSWRPPLPTKVVREPIALRDRTDPMYDHIPQGVDEDGQTVYWDISGQMAHMLKAGRTRTGKTVSLIGDTVEVAGRAYQVYIIDPKRNEFLGMRGWPNVRVVATRVPDQVALLRKMLDLMEERYRLIEEEGALEDDFDRVVLLVDEYRLFYANVKAWYLENKPRSAPAKPPPLEWFGALLRAAAACKINVILATQRPDAEFLDGEIRDNFSARGATGRLSPDGATMMYDSHYIGTKIPMSIRGRGTMIGLDDIPREIQYAYTPDPRKARQRQDKDELALLDKLRPATTTWCAQRLEYPDDDGLSEWDKALRAHLVDVEETAGDELEAQAAEDESAAEDMGYNDADGDWVEQPYGPIEHKNIGKLEPGWMAQLDDEGTWVVIAVADPSDDDPDMVSVVWHGDDDTEGMTDIPSDTRVPARPPLDNSEEGTHDE